jgi:uroporphyrinogen-III synthase
MSDRPALLLTRPAAQSERFARAWGARMGDNWPVILSPLMAPVFLPADLDPDRYGGVIFTSETGVEALVRNCGAPRIPAWCVGERTAEAARRSGFAVRVGCGNAETLAEAIIASRPQGRLLSVRGVHQAADIRTRLESSNLDTEEAILYDQVEQPPTAEARACLKRADPLLLPLFSPRSARLVGRVLPQPHAPLLVAAMSGAVAAEARSLAPASLEVASAPTSDAMLDALVKLARATRA